MILCCILRAHLKQKHHWYVKVHQYFGSGSGLAWIRIKNWFLDPDPYLKCGSRSRVLIQQFTYFPVFFSKVRVCSLPVLYICIKMRKKSKYPYDYNIVVAWIRISIAILGWIRMSGCRSVTLRTVYGVCVQSKLPYQAHEVGIWQSSLNSHTVHTVQYKAH